MGRKTYVLPGKAGSNELIQEVAQALKGASAAFNHEYVYRGPRAAKPGVTAYTWMELRYEIEVMLGVDEEIPARYISVQVADDTDGDRVGEILSRKLSALSRDTLIAQARHFEKDPGGVLRLSMAVFGEDHDKEVTEILTSALASKNSRVRSNAAMGATFIRSSKLVKPLRAALKNEDDAGVKRLLKAAIAVSAD